MVAGALAGSTVDFVLFPLDTLKTRLQSAQGFARSGGARGLYRGLGVTLLGSAPSSAVFFTTFEGLQPHMRRVWGTSSLPQEVVDIGIRALAAAAGELAASTVRAPVEAIKQNRQVGVKVSYSQCATTWAGWRATVARDVSFSSIQYPVYFLLKKSFADSSIGDPITPMQSAICGAISASFSAIVTTPLDVAQTRLMVGTSGKQSPTKLSGALRCIYREGGFCSLFAGCGLRTTWMGLGGLIFLGSYEQYTQTLQRYGLRNPS
eukprot:TRINITY_DN48148_c0_g1_i1.p1 TRINITY_DN48148_c0_g1~~TRINITY_DN48148_c0_g1_i1.p1  ORF type:complete len:295 (-),score=31.96 TRINITY_DN48148_c0_g1_i1:230-1018(-)